MILTRLSQLPPDTPLRDALDEIDHLYSLPHEIEERTGHLPTDAQLMAWFDCGDVMAWVEGV